MNYIKTIASFLTLLLYIEAVFGNIDASNISEPSPQDKHYLFLFFYKQQDQRTMQSEQIFDHTMQALGLDIQSAKINITDPNHKGIIAKYGVERAPMPMALVVAPNGAITGGFPYTFSAEQLKNAMVSPVVAHVLNGLQNRKLVFVCVQNQTTEQNDQALQGINEMRNDPRFLNAIEYAIVDPSEDKEKDFLYQFGVNTLSKQAQTVFLAPPGDKINIYSGPTNKEQFINDLQKAVSGCCPGGCCPGGCCPGGCCGK